MITFHNNTVLGLIREHTDCRFSDASPAEIEYNAINFTELFQPRFRQTFLH